MVMDYRTKMNGLMELIQIILVVEVTQGHRYMIHRVGQMMMMSSLMQLEMVGKKKKMKMQ